MTVVFAKQLSFAKIGGGKIGKIESRNFTEKIEAQNAQSIFTCPCSYEYWIGFAF
jgi:hypothetical protein